MGFDLATSTEAEQKDDGLKTSSGFDFSSSRTSPSDSHDSTPFEDFSKVKTEKPSFGKTVGGEPILKPYKTETVPTQYPDKGWLNGLVTSAEGAAWSLVAKPILGMKDEGVDKLLADTEKQHPIASMIGGTAPFIVTAPLFPEGLIGLSAQFGSLGALSAVGRERVDAAADKPIVEKGLSIAKEAAKGAALGPVFHYSKALKFMARPFATALARAGAVGVGSGTVSAVFGDDLHEAFKQTGLMGGLALIFESPGLAKSVLGRGIIAHANKVHAEVAAKEGLPEAKIDPESPTVKEDIAKVTEGLATQIKGVDKPQVIAATIRIPTSGAEKPFGFSTAEEYVASKKISPEVVSNGEVSDRKVLNVWQKAETGNPIEVYAYHAKEGSIDSKLTDDAKLKIERETLLGDGWYGARDKDIAEMFGKNPSLHKVKLENPYVIVADSKTELLNITNEKLQEIKDAGHDGIIVKPIHKNLSSHDRSPQQIVVFGKPKSQLTAEWEAEKAKGYKEIDAASHEDALNKIGKSKNDLAETAGDGKKEIKVRKTRGPTKKSRTFIGVVQSFGGIDLESAKAAGYTYKDFKEFGLLSVLKKGGGKIDGLASELSGTGYLPEGSTANDLMAKLKESKGEVLSKLKEKETDWEKLNEEHLARKAEAAADVERAVESRREEDFTGTSEESDFADLIASVQEATGIDITKPISGETSPKESHQEGFRVLNPNGKTEFITRAQAKEMFGKDQSHEFEGLNQQKFVTQPEGLKVTNPETLKAVGERSSGEEGKIDVNLIPGVVEVSEGLKNAHDAWMKTLVPPEVGKEAKYTAQITREQLGIQARAWDKLGEALKGARLKFDKANKDSSLDFIDKMEAGAKHDTPELQQTADTLRKLHDDKWAEIQATGKVAEDKFIENYFPHYWEKPGMVGKALRQVMAKRPLYGSKSFLKKRVFMTTKEGIEAGFTPVTYNPIDLTMLKLREMDKFLAAHKTRTALREQGLEKFVKSGGEKPEGWVKIEDGSSEVRSVNEDGEMVVRGSYFTQPDAARIINNHLSPGLRGNWLYDTYRGAGNTLNQFQLGMSAFHLGFTSMDATISKFAIGLNHITAGRLASGIKEIGKAPFAPVTNFMQGRDLLQAWYGKDMGPLTNAIADAMATAGGRAKMDSFYSTKAHESLQKALKEGKSVTAAMKVPMWIVEQMSRPIMEYIVPRQKMGVFVDMMKFEMDRRPNMSHSELRDVAQKAWDSVDNRMGQVVYDNLFWNRVVKDLGMAEVRSLGWNLGTFREIGGGVKDLTDLKAMREGGLSYRSAYLIALPMVAGFYGAIYQYLHTGKGPEELKDYYFPKTGGLDKSGKPARVSLPTYMKDLYHYSQAPVQTVLNKVTPVHSAIIQMLNNKDFYGTKIRNEDDPIMQQFRDVGIYVGSQFVPFGIRNLGKDTRKTTGSVIEPFIGITPAPYDVNMTKAEKSAMEMTRAKMPVGSRTKEQAEHSKTKSKLKNEYFVSGDPAPLQKAVTDKVITPKEKKAIIKEKGMTRLERSTQHLTFEETASLMDKATEGEKKELKTILEKKRRGKRRTGTWNAKLEKLFEEETE